MDYQLLPMLAESKSLKSVDELDAKWWAAERKFDGWRLICHRTEDGVRVWGGRNGSEYTGHLLYLEASLLDVLPPDTVIDGEIVAEAGFGSVQSEMSKNEPHIPTFNSPALTLWIFDILRVDGTDVRMQRWDQRRRLVEAIQVGPHMQINPVLPTTQASYEKVVAIGGEGLVLKRKASRYINARSRDWKKLKVELTAEGKVVGFKPGENGFAGLVGAIEFELLESDVRSRCSGFDMELRQAMSENPDAYMGRIFEIKFNPGVGKDGKPRSPNFLRWREDREPGPGPVSTLKQPARKPRTDEGKRKMRNYGAMKKPGKLEQCIEELENQTGDAYDRCVASGGDPDEDLRVAREALAKRGLSLVSGD